ncbi:gamma-glutamylputrescine oxidoreductase, partial [Vibrio parahaemolyticus]|uniref:NAD(P)/FAD-dependent oxidoreductase n=1 Tax=Vibrio parahaemolyticus TaxID=670 RepID=UPI00062B0CD0
VDVIESRYDQNQAKALCDMIFEGGDIIRGLIDKHDINCDYKQGGLFTALNSKQHKGLEEHKKNWERYGNDQLTLLDAGEVEQAVGTKVYTGGLLDMRGGHILPLKLVLGEAAAFISLGGQIFEQSAV